nr:hypothetical protein [Tanacetum cinerariifolium]
IVTELVKANRLTCNLVVATKPSPTIITTVVKGEEEDGRVICGYVKKTKSYGVKSHYNIDLYLILISKSSDLQVLFECSWEGDGFVGRGWFRRKGMELHLKNLTRTLINHAESKPKASSLSKPTHKPASF